MLQPLRVQTGQGRYSSQTSQNSYTSGFLVASFSQKHPHNHPVKQA